MNVTTVQYVLGTNHIIHNWGNVTSENTHAVKKSHNIIKPRLRYPLTFNNA